MLTLFDAIVNEENLWNAWSLVARKKSAPGLAWRECARVRASARSGVASFAPRIVLWFLSARPTSWRASAQKRRRMASVRHAFGSRSHRSTGVPQRRGADCGWTVLQWQSRLPSGALDSLGHRSGRVGAR